MPRLYILFLLSIPSIPLFLPLYLFPIVSPLPISCVISSYLSPSPFLESNIFLPFSLFILSSFFSLYLACIYFLVFYFSFLLKLPPLPFLPFFASLFFLSYFLFPFTVFTASRSISLRPSSLFNFSPFPFFSTSLFFSHSFSFISFLPSLVTSFCPTFLFNLFPFLFFSFPSFS